MRPHCYGSPTTFSPTAATCGSCAAFADCGQVSLSRVRALVRLVPMPDLENLLEAGMKGAGMPVGEAGCADTPTPTGTLRTTIRPPARSFDTIKRKTLVTDEQVWLDTLPVKVAKRLGPMIKSGLLRTVPAKVAQGVNPFPKDNNRFLHEAMTELMSAGLLTKRYLRQVFEERLGWTEGTAFSHVAVAGRLFVALQVAVDGGDCLYLRRNPTTKVGE